MTIRTSALGWGALAGAAGVAAAGPLPIGPGFAAVGIGMVGMAHGASDLVVVPCARRSAFLPCYAAVSLACLAWWTADPAVAAPGFLLASAIHFGMEDAPTSRPVERVARGVAWSRSRP